MESRRGRRSAITETVGCLDCVADAAYSCGGAFTQWCSCSLPMFDYDMISKQSIIHCEAVQYTTIMGGNIDECECEPNYVHVKLLDCGCSNWTRSKWHMPMLSRLLLLNPFTIMCHQLHHRPLRDRLWFTNKHRPMLMLGQLNLRYGFAQLHERCSCSRNSRRKGTNPSNSSCDWFDYRVSSGDRDGSRDANHGSATLYEETKPELIIKWSRSKDTLKKPWSNYVPPLI